MRWAAIAIMAVALEAVIIVSISCAPGSVYFTDEASCLPRMMFTAAR